MLFDHNSELTEKLNVDVEQVKANNQVTYSSIHSDIPPGVPACSMKPSIDTHSTDFCVSKNRRHQEENNVLELFADFNFKIHICQ